MAESDTTEHVPGHEAAAEPKPCNRRESARRLPRNLLCVECRAGLQGLGPNIADHALDISETGMSFASRIELPKMGKVQAMLFARGHSGCIKMLGEVVRCRPLDGGLFDVALQFEHRLKYADYQLLT